MTRPGRIAARLVAAGLALAASLPGRLQLVHHHAGGEHVHGHADAEHLAVRDLVAAHGHERHAHAHSHPHPHPAERHRHHENPPASGGGTGGLTLRALDPTHVHGLDPFQQVARTAVLPDAVVLAHSHPAASDPPPPPDRPGHAARSRGPPTILAG